MKDLMSLQDKFQAYLLDANNQIEDLIVGTDKVPVELRLMVYGNAYRSRLLEALESTYPVLKAYLGDDDFYQLGHEYLDAFPSTYPSIRWFGDQLSAFLKDHEYYSNHPYLAELALVEWTMTLVFDAADSSILTVEDINLLPGDAWETLKIQFIPSMHRLSLSWNVFEIWQTISADGEPPEPVASVTPVHWVLWRNALINHYSSIAEEEVFAIDRMTEQHTFGMVCEGLCQWMDEESAVIKGVTLLKGWIVSGMVRGV